MKSVTAIGSVGLMGLIAGCIVQVGGGEAEWSFLAPSAVQVDVGNGDIHVVSSFDDRLVVRWDGGGFNENAYPDVVELADGTIDVDANGGIAGGGTVDLELPTGTDLELLVDRGSIEVRLDEPTNLFACAGAGSIDIAMPPGPYRLELGAMLGVIDNGIVDDPNGPYTIEVCLGAGDVTLRSR